VNDSRPAGITALSAFFLFGAVMSFTSSAALLFPGGLLEPMWRLNPRAREGFDKMGPWAIVLMLAVCAACALSATGLWRGVAWGHRLATGVLVVNVLGDAASALSGTEPRAGIGVPIGAALVAYLRSKRVRSFFDEHSRVHESLPRMQRAFVVLETRGSGWDESRPMEEQTDWPAHAAFMDSLVAGEFVALGGPLEGTRDVLLVIQAKDSSEIARRLSADPWTRNGLLIVKECWPWRIRHEVKRWR